MREHLYRISPYWPYQDKKEVNQVGRNLPNHVRLKYVDYADEDQREISALTGKLQYCEITLCRDKSEMLEASHRK